VFRVPVNYRNLPKVNVTATSGYVTVTLVIFDKQWNARRIEVESYL